jgi:uncharacterized protein
MTANQELCSERTMASSDEYPGGASRIWTDIDLEVEGKSFGYFRLPFSTHEHGAAWIPIPVAVLKNGAGPRVLLMAGNHGDEYEGQVMLMKLLRTIQLHDVQGQITIMSAANAPAVYAGRRVSPLDGGNMNRLFPGDSDGSPTAQIAYFIESVLLPRVDYVFDFHSGGSSDEFLPSAHVFYSPDRVRFERSLHFLKVFGMPNSLVVKGLMGNDQKLFGACQRAGVFHMSTELGGAGRVSVGALRLAEQGLARLLFDVGVVRRPLTSVQAPASRLLTRVPTRKYLYAPATGLFEPYVELGSEVKIGQPAGAIHFPETPWREPVVVVFGDSGIVACVRSLARTFLGDCLFMLAVPWML